jgi:hypothetical protein
MQGLLNITAVDKMLPVQAAEAVSTLYLLLKEPDSWHNHVRRYSTAVILATVFGQRGLRYESKRVRDLYAVQDRFNFLLEGTTPPVDAFPVLKYMPAFLAPWKKEAAEIRQGQKDLYEGLYFETKARMQEEDMDCFMASMINDIDKHELEEPLMAQLGGIFVSVSTCAETLPQLICEDGSWLRYNCGNTPFLGPGHGEISTGSEKGTGGTRHCMRSGKVSLGRRLWPPSLSARLRFRGTIHEIEVQMTRM